VTKPFSVRELLARIAALLRRARRNDKNLMEKSSVPAQFMIGNATVDTLEFKARIGTRIFDLSAREVKLLQIFYANPNKVLSREQLLNEVWGITYYGTTRTLDQHIAQLRKKITPDGPNHAVISTVHGVGYRYEAD
jgi:DNA-binding response OmpR family regulator